MMNCCYGVQGFVKVVNQCGTKSEFRMENGLNACARGYKRLKVHPTFIYSCHSFWRLYKLVLGHAYEKSYQNLALVFAHDIKTFEGYTMPSHVLISSLPRVFDA